MGFKNSYQVRILSNQLNKLKFSIRIHFIFNCMVNLIAMPYLPKVKIVKRGRPSSTKGSIGCVSLVYQLFKILQNKHSWVATNIIDKR